MDGFMLRRSATQGQSRWFPQLAPLFAMTCVGLTLLAISVVIILSLIPLFLQEVGHNIAVNNDKESGLITNSYSSNLVLDNNQATTVTNTDDTARQLETSLQLPSGSLRVSTVLFNGVNGGRRRRQNRRTERQISGCDVSSSNNTLISFKIAIVYPSSCGQIQSCKKNFYTTVETRLVTYTGTFSCSLTFSDGRSVSVQLTLCNSTIDTTSSSTSTSVTTVTTSLSHQSTTLPSNGTTGYSTTSPTIGTSGTSGYSMYPTTTPAVGTSGMSGYSMYPTTTPTVGKRRRRSSIQGTTTSHIPIGGIIIISLDDRGANLTSKLYNASTFVKYLPNGVQRMEAVDGQQLDFYAFLREGKLTKSAYIKLVTQDTPIGGHYLTTGAVGCLETHVRAWQRTVEIGMPMLIFEDDLHVNMDLFDAVLPYLLYALPTNFSLLYFGNLVSDSIQASLINYNDLLWKMTGANWGTYAYLISPEAAAILLESIYPIRAQVDSMIIEIAQFESFDVFMSKQTLVETNNENRRASRIQRYLVSPIVIPHTFHFIWLNNKPLSPAAQWNLQRWAELHPNWEIRMWTNESNITSSLYNQKYFNRSAHIPRQASDILRYEIVYQYGGIYVDIDFEPLQNIEPLLHGIQAFVVHESELFVCNGIFGAIPGHQLTERLVIDLSASWTEYENSTINQRTGPYYMTRQVQAMDGKKKTIQGGFQIFSPHLFFPYAWYEQDPGHPYDPHAFAVHHFRSIAEINRNAEDGQ